MCTRPITIRNKSLLRSDGDPLKFTVPCGHCAECIKKLRDSYELRFFYEYQLCKKYWPTCSQFFLTLTYNNDSVPFYEDEAGDRHYCADFSDVQKCLKLLRKYLKCGIRYFAVVEFGEGKIKLSTENGVTKKKLIGGRGRVHYHLYIITEHAFAEAYMQYLLLTKCWCKYKKVNVNGELKSINLGSRGFIKNISVRMTDGQRRKDFNSVRYICKYLNKYDSDVKFNGPQSLRVRCSLGFGLGPNHEVPFTESQLVQGYTFLPYSQTNRYYIPSIYYNSYLKSFDDLKKNSRYVNFVQDINLQIFDHFFNNNNSSDLFDCLDRVADVTSYLRSKRFSTPEYQSIKLNRLVFSFSKILAQIPNLYYNNFFNEYRSDINKIYLKSFGYQCSDFEIDNSYTDNLDYFYIYHDIADKYTNDDLLDCMLYVLPNLDRSSDGYFLSSGRFVVDPYIYCDVCFLFNCLTFYIKSNQDRKNLLSNLEEEKDFKKQQYQRRIYYEKLYLPKCPVDSRRELRTSERWCNSLHHRDNREKVSPNLSTVDRPF